ncbi:hypothetical protein [Guyparkeria halopsychrophila]|uniref:hypothetical protein n=1 Tax=Guyparkeria halopsychrophila TaxID=3139421 RepID=UPI0037C63417
MNTNRFIYRDSKGGVSICEPALGRVVGSFLQGFDGQAWRTFVLDRIAEECPHGEECEDRVEHWRSSDEPIPSATPTDTGLRVAFVDFPDDELELMEDEAHARGAAPTVPHAGDLDILCVYGELTPTRFRVNDHIMATLDRNVLILSQDDLQWLLDFGEIRDHD